MWGNDCNQHIMTRPILTEPTAIFFYLSKKPLPPEVLMTREQLEYLRSLEPTKTVSTYEEYVRRFEEASKIPKADLTMYKVAVTRSNYDAVCSETEADPNFERWV